MKIVALLCGFVASIFAWGAGVYLTDIGVQFLDLWPETISQQFLGLVVWHAIVAAALVGGVLTVLSPVSGALMLLAVAAGWAWLAYILPIGFDVQTIVPIVLSGLGVLAAVGAMFRGRARRQHQNRQPTPEDIEREEALRFEPSEEAVPTPSERLALDPEPAVTGIIPTPERPRRSDEAPPHGLSGAMAANVAILILLAAGLGILSFSEFRSGDLMAAFSPSGPRAARVAEGAPTVAAPALAPTPAETDESTATGASDTATIGPAPASTPASPEPSNPATEQRSQVASVSADGTSLSTSSDGPFADPFAYCAAVDTIDFPDYRYTGPHLVDDIADVLQVPVSSSPDRVKWRCYGGAVLACAAFDGPVCAATPSVAEMVEFCAKNPNARDLLAPNGSWSCNETRPEIPAGENWPVDARGFLPAAWQVVSRP